MSTLPQEVIDIVVDELSSAGNKKDLSPVALSARTFLYRAQFHLFRSITLELFNCLQQISQDSATFHAILRQSPTIKFHVREIFISDLGYDALDWDPSLFDPSWECPVHTNSKQQHFFTQEIMEQLHLSKISHCFSILLLLTRLRAIRVNYTRLQCQRDWPTLLTRDGQNLIRLFGFQRSIRTLTLRSLRHVPMAVMDEILELSQLTTLIIDDIVLDDAALQHRPTNHSSRVL